MVRFSSPLRGQMLPLALLLSTSIACGPPPSEAPTIRVHLDVFAHHGLEACRVWSYINASGQRFDNVGLEPFEGKLIISEYEIVCGNCEFTKEPLASFDIVERVSADTEGCIGFDNVTGEKKCACQDGNQPWYERAAVIDWSATSDGGAAGQLIDACDQPPVKEDLAICPSPKGLELVTRLRARDLDF